MGLICFTNQHTEQLNGSVIGAGSVSRWCKDLASCLFAVCMLPTSVKGFTGVLTWFGLPGGNHMIRSF